MDIEKRLGKIKIRNRSNKPKSTNLGFNPLEDSDNDTSKEPASKPSPSTTRKHNSNNNRGGRNNRNQRRNDQKFNNPFVNPLDDSPAKETSQSQNSKVIGHHSNPLSGEVSGRKPADELPGDYPNPLLRNDSHMGRRGQKVVNRNPEINKKSQHDEKHQQWLKARENERKKRSEQNGGREWDFPKVKNDDNYESRTFTHKNKRNGKSSFTGFQHDDRFQSNSDDNRKNSNYHKPRYPKNASKAHQVKQKENSPDKKELQKQDEIEPQKLSPLKNVEIITDWAAECEDISNNSY